MQVWDGTWALLDILQSDLGQSLCGRRVVELGSGTGLAGLCAAAMGCHVLMTDVKSVTNGVLRPNINLNAALRDTTAISDHPGPDASACATQACRNAAPQPLYGQPAVPDKHRATPSHSPTNARRRSPANASETPQGGGSQAHGICSTPGASHTPDLLQLQDGDDLTEAVQAGGEAGASHFAAGAGWPGARDVGRGTVAALPLDWTVPVPDQVAQPAGEGLLCVDPRDADAIIACEVIWLKELIEPYVSTVVALLRGPRRPVCYMSYTARGHAKSTVFAYEGEVRAAFAVHGCHIEELSTFQTRTSDGEKVLAWKITLACS